MRKIKILFDANPLVNGNKSGVGYYTQGIIQALATTYPDDLQLVGHYFSFLGRKDGVPLPSASNITYKRSRLIPGKILSLTRMLGFQPPLELFFKQRGDAALFTNFVSLPSLTGIPKLVAVHDLCYIDVPQYVSEKNRNFLTKFVPQSVKTAAKVITISESTKKAIKSHYKTNDSKFLITPIPPGKKTLGKDFDLSSLGINKKFVLFVSTLEPRKNVINLVKAYELLPASIKSHYQLVLAGGAGWYMEETMNYIKQLQDRGEGIITTGYISDEARARLYENASLFALPSHYEGFGMPILEAMSYAIPTAVSDIPVFHEVAGNASVYFDKDDPRSIANAISSVLANEDTQKKLIKNGEEQLRKYDWNTVAKSVFETIQKLK